jgi:hypothetical protein
VFEILPHQSQARLAAEVVGQFFDNEGANKLTASYKFIYNRLYKSYGAPMII